MTDFSALSLRALLPAPLRSDEEIAIVADIISADLQKINNTVKLINLKATLAQQTDAVLDELGYEKHIEGYSSTLSRAVRESLIHRAIQLHRYKGTPASMQSALDSLGYGITIAEWFDYDGEPYHFKIELDLYGQEISDAEYALIDTFIDQYKNVRSKLDGITVNFALDGLFYEAVSLQTSEIITLKP
ncbi:MAG: phage tail protein I [Deferribacterales bacterium]